MAKKYIPEPGSLQELIRSVEGSSYTLPRPLEAVAFETEEIYPNGTMAVNTYEINGGGWHFYLYVEDILKLVSYCAKHNIRTFFVRDNYDELVEF